MAVRRFLYQDIFSVVFTAPVAIVPIAGFAGIESPVVAKRVPVAVQRFSDFTPFDTTPATASPDMGAYFQWPERFVKPLAVSLQQFMGFVAVPKPPPLGWWGQSPALFVKPVSLATRQLAGFTSIPVAAPQGWWGPLPTPFIKPFPVSLQRFGDVVPQAPVAAVATIVAGFRGDDSPVAAKRVSAALQRFPDFAPLGTVVTATPQGWWTPSPEQIKKPLSPKLQQFAGFVQIPVAGVPTATANWWSRWPERFIKPFPAKLQQFSGFQPLGTILPPTLPPQGWWGQSPVRFVGRFPAKLQQFSGFFARIPDIFPPHGPGLKNEVLRTNWLVNSNVRVTYLKNERIRMTSLQDVRVRVSFLMNEQIRITQL